MTGNNDLSVTLLPIPTPGPPGPKGEKGDQGIQGPQGNPGTNGTNGTHQDPPCFDNTNRYVNCGNGTVTDTVTGLIWLQAADCLGTHDWAAANQAAAVLTNGQCSLTDNSSPGDWRLPTKDEWSTTIARAVALGCTSSSGPSLTNDAGTGCLVSGGGTSFAGVALDFYWSSTTVVTNPIDDWTARLDLPLDPGLGKVFALRVWPVRGGAR